MDNSILRLADVKQYVRLSKSQIYGKRLGNSSCPDARYQVGVVASIQLCGSNSPMRLAGWVGRRSRTFLRYR